MSPLCRRQHLDLGLSVQKSHVFSVYQCHETVKDDCWEHEVVTLGVSVDFNPEFIFYWGISVDQSCDPWFIGGFQFVHSCDPGFIGGFLLDQSIDPGFIGGFHQDQSCDHGFIGEPDLWPWVYWRISPRPDMWPWGYWGTRVVTMDLFGDFCWTRVQALEKASRILFSLYL